MRSSEFQRILRLRARLSRVKSPGVAVGIGDDCAVLSPSPGRRLVWTVDCQVENVHFRRDLLSWEDVGYRAVMAAASDIAAMGARPWSSLVALAFPRTLEDEELDRLIEGVATASEELGAEVAGGNLSAAGEVSITTTLLGACDAEVLRSGARGGDGIWIAGDVGLATLGFKALEREIDGASVSAAVRAWRRPVARISDGLRMVKVAHAAIDVSDGLAQDVGHIAEASGVSAVIDAEALLGGAGELRRIAEALGEDPLKAALFGGEDYALVVASPGAIEGFRRIGEFRGGSGGAGVILKTAQGEQRVEGGGFEHFRGGGA